jgi:hypothetical protein
VPHGAGNSKRRPALQNVGVPNGGMPIVGRELWRTKEEDVLWWMKDFGR